MADASPFVKPDPEDEEKKPLAALDDKQGALTLGFAIKAGTPMSYLALEGGAEATKKQKRYNLRLSGRAMF
ncbi:MAG: hypothetical protein B7X77_03910 [Caulobacter sp. 39-67-4]|nr:MAG: hypothetical protein B7X77_03910 [Caulobacter sp. 39-67-4]